MRIDEQIKILEEYIKDYRKAETSSEGQKRVSKIDYEKARSNYDNFINETNDNAKLSINELYKKYTCADNMKLHVFSLVKRKRTYFYVPALIALWVDIFDIEFPKNIMALLVSIACFGIAISGSISAKKLTEEEKNIAVTEYNNWARKQYDKLKAEMDKSKEELDSYFTLNDWYDKYRFIYEGPDSFMDYATNTDKYSSNIKTYFSVAGIKAIINRFKTNEGNKSIKECAAEIDREDVSAYNLIQAQRDLAAIKAEYFPIFSYDSSAQDEANKAMMEAAEAQKNMANQQMEMIKKQEAEARRKENHRKSIQRNIDSLSVQLQNRERELTQLHRAYKLDQGSISYAEGEIGRLKAQIQAEQARMWSV